MKHTPGPWYVAGHSGDADRSILATTRIHHNPRAVARVYGDGVLAKPNEENVANAVLISKAPDLLAVLKQALSTIGVLKTYCDNALTVTRAAEREIQIEKLISEAEGES